MRKKGIITGGVPHWSNSHYRQHGSPNRTTLLLLPFQPNSLFCCQCLLTTAQGSRPIPADSATFYSLERGKTCPSPQDRNSVSMLPHHSSPSFMNCYKVISCKCWTRLSKNLTRFASFSNAWKHVPTGNEIKTFKLLANREFVKNSSLN